MTSKLIASMFFAGAAAGAVALGPVAMADPPAPPPCVNADGTACADTGMAGPGGATGEIPGGPGGTAGPGGASGSIPYGPGGTAGPGGASGSIPYGPGGTAGPGGATGGIPNGPVGTAGPGGASGCIPNVGCATIPGQ
jgi:hypothetical protein